MGHLWESYFLYLPENKSLQLVLFELPGWELNFGDFKQLHSRFFCLLVPNNDRKNIRNMIPLSF